MLSLDNIMARKINIINEAIRKTMNDTITEINGDFTGWCELGSMLMFRYIKENFPNLNVKIIEGTFKNEGHFWNEINGLIVDTTIDQFGKYKSGVVNKKFLNNYNPIKEKIYKDKEDFNNFIDDVYNYIYCNV